MFDPSKGTTFSPYVRSCILLTNRHEQFQYGYVRKGSLSPVIVWKYDLYSN